MASRSSTRVCAQMGRCLRQHQTLAKLRSSSLHTSTKTRAAQNFTMPAMSPTMTEGNIASWKVKEGDSFSSGDVLLEIETDKAQMDVEAQDDGKMARIFQDSGSKAVKVGTRIAVIAEVDDDLSNLEMPPEASEGSAKSEAKEQSTTANASSTKSSKVDQSHSSERAIDQSTAQTTKKTAQLYPLYPSITQLLLAHNIPLHKADEIPASGPKGRLLKGDVLAFIGSIQSSYPSELASRLKKLQAMDLDNIKPAPKSTESAISDKRVEVTKDTKLQPTTLQVSVAISLSRALSVQKRVEETLGIHLPLSTFIMRASELANQGLPKCKGSTPSIDELFDDIVGVSASIGTRRGSVGNYVPQINAKPRNHQEGQSPKPQQDIYDLLTGAPLASRSTSKSKTLPPGLRIGANAGDDINVFSLEVEHAEGQRAKVFLERVKTILQVEPGRLVL